MNHFLLTPTDRLAHWKDFRTHISKLPEREIFQLVADYWALAPMMKMACDIEDPTSWLSPWEMVSDGDWCPYSVAIGMEFTLRLSGIDPSRMKIFHIRDYDISEERFVLEIDESIMLNYNVGHVESECLASNRNVLAVFQNDGKRYFALTK